MNEALEPAPQMPAELTAPLFCSRCQAEIRPTDNYCHACGKSLKPGHGFLFTHSGIILMSLVLGPFVLPLVWMSKVISRPAKIIYTVALILIGSYMVYALWHAFSAMNQTLQNVLNGNLENLGSVNRLGGL